MSLEEVRKVKRKYSNHLMSFKNVVSVGVGRKRVNGKETNELAIVVGVSEKLPENKLKKTDIIPKKLDGIKTDVIQVGEITAL
ncbi:MAG: hypothetical protein JSW11_01830 [Candidatus Heimdallarchaeota archaeon]|nr:MAG: hypothetical protein JSW11_01830 [Candidatus Heimdallarchaeota archaeon]